MIITSDPIIPSTADASDPSSRRHDHGPGGTRRHRRCTAELPGRALGRDGHHVHREGTQLLPRRRLTNAVGTVATSKKAGVGWGAGAQTIDFIASPYLSENMPDPASVTSSTPVHGHHGSAPLDDGSGTAAMVPITCTGLTAAGANSTLTGCTVPVGGPELHRGGKDLRRRPRRGHRGRWPRWSSRARAAHPTRSSSTRTTKTSAILRVAYTTDGSTF